MDLKLARQSMNIVTHKLLKALEAIWQTMLKDESLRSFYFQLHNDVADMIKTPMKSTFYLHIFLHSKMLGLSESQAEGLSPHDFIKLMNADLPVIQMDRKMEEVSVMIDNLRKKTDAVAGLGPSKVLYWVLQYRLMMRFNVALLLHVL